MKLKTGDQKDLKYGAGRITSPSLTQTANLFEVY